MMLLLKADQEESVEGEKVREKGTREGKLSANTIETRLHPLKNANRFHGLICWVIVVDSYKVVTCFLSVTQSFPPTPTLCSTKFICRREHTTQLSH